MVDTTPSLYNKVLEEYFSGDQSIAAKMLNNGYLTKPAKTAGFAGKEYLKDQSLYVHIVNGVFAITRLLSYLASMGLYQLTEEEFRTALAMYTNHDLHKVPEVERGKRGEFDVSLDAFRKEGEVLGLFDFANVSPEQMRLGMMHLNKNMVGDLSAVPSNTTKLISIVRLADSLASMQEPSAYRGLTAHLNELSPRLIGRFKFYHHELSEYRGLTTQLLHLCISEILEKHYQCYPLFYFANGVMYIGPTEVRHDSLSEDIVTVVSKNFFATVQQKMQRIGGKVAQDALNPQQTVKFEQYAYLFSDVSQLLDSLTSYASKKAPRRFISDLVAKRAEKRPSFVSRYPTPAIFCQHYQIDVGAEDDNDFSAKWWAVSQCVKGVESIARDMMGDKEALIWTLKTMQTPEAIQESIISDIANLRSGGVADHCLIIAYHYLVHQIYGADKRSAHAVELGDILNQLIEYLSPRVEEIANLDSRQRIIDHELAMKQDLNTYLLESLQCSHPSFAHVISAPADVFTEYQQRRKGSSHQRLCVLCSRVIPAGMKNPIIKTGIIEDQALVFSNKLVPRETVTAQMVWCPMCYLEFMLRQLNGLGYPGSADPALSDRLYIYLFPDYFFTPEQVKLTSDVLRPFREETALKLRQYGKDDASSLPVLWMRERRFSRRIQRDALETLRREAAHLGEELLDNKKRPTGRRRKELPGDRQKASQLEALNYFLIPCEKSAAKASSELAPTRSELWCKAVYTSLIAYLLLGVRVYITDKPYPAISTKELKHIITLDAPHTLLRGLLNQSSINAVIRLAKGKGEQETITVQEAMDAISALWIINEYLSRNIAGSRRNLDKDVASLLSQINSNPLAGAAFYKERQRDDLPVTSEFTQACTYLLELMGGWKLDLAKKLAHQSLAIFLPARSRDNKGKANQYEKLFRLALEQLKRMPGEIEADEMIARIAGTLEKAVSRQEDLNKGGHFTGKINCSDDELKKRAEVFAHTIVVELFIKRCGRNISKLLTEENSLADGIFHVTDCELGTHWEDYQRRRNGRKVAVTSNGQEHTPENEGITSHGSLEDEK
jgi:CRISPR-associated protein Csc3